MVYIKHTETRRRDVIKVEVCIKYKSTSGWNIEGVFDNEL